ncbi:transposase [Gammaproteobacteria bacterium]
MILVHKIRLYPNDKQVTLFEKSCGVARFAYNWALAEWQRQYEAGEKPNETKLRKQLNAIKKEQFPWMTEVSKTAPQQAIKNLGRAFQNTFSRIKTGEKPGFPRFKRKGVHDSFRADNGPSKYFPNAVKVIDNRVRLPVIGWVRMAEEVRFDGNIKSATVSKEADQWHVALAIETTEILSGKIIGAIGVDLGIKSLAILSNGEVIEGPKAHKRLLGRIQRLSRSLSRKKKGSTNRWKAKTKLSRMHLRISNIRKDNIHKLTTKLATEFELIGIEDLNVKGMIKNHCLARAVSDAGFFEFRRQLDYKSAMTSSKLIIVDRWFPSSKTCSVCGAIHDMPLAERTMSCGCGNKMDRDLNAAINLKNYAVSSTGSVCGEDSAGVMRLGDVKLPQ